MWPHEGGLMGNQISGCLVVVTLWSEHCKLMQLLGAKPQKFNTKIFSTHIEKMKASSHLKSNQELSFSLTVFVCKVVTKSIFEILEMNATDATFCAHNKHAPQGMHEKMATFSVHILGIAFACFI